MADIETPVESYLAAGRERRIATFSDFLRIPSVSADPAFAADVHRAAK